MAKAVIQAHGSIKESTNEGTPDEQQTSERMACTDCKKYSGYVTERDDGNARRQFVPTNCACSPAPVGRWRGP